MQGVGFRPFAYRLAHRYGLVGWVKNGDDGVVIHAEGPPAALDSFASALRAEAPPAAAIASLVASDADRHDYAAFEIRESVSLGRPTVRIAPDLAACDACLRELFDPRDRRYRYPYINCTDCGPRYSIVRELPYDRPRTTMAAWPMCAPCAAEYDDPSDRRFHAQPIACHACGPAYVFEDGTAPRRGDAALVATAAALRAGAIVAIKGIGGYHLACDARNPDAVESLRARKFRKERPFAVLVPDLARARELVELDARGEAFLTSIGRPIVLGVARVNFAGVAPGNRELGVMLAYTPLHALLFADGAPQTLVLTSANRSSEPIAYEDAEARETLAGIADAFLIGERPIARRIDDSVVRSQAGRGAMLRRSRGFAPQCVARVPSTRPILALGGDLKNAIALVVEGSVVASQHIGDLEQHAARNACLQTVHDLCAIYAVAAEDALVVCDAHPGYASSALARELSQNCLTVQHHRSHVASVLAEREAWTTRCIGVAFDGTGYGDDGTIWGGEFFTGSVRDGFERIGHLRTAQLPGGDAASRFPVQAAAGFLTGTQVPDMTRAPFYFPQRFAHARELVTRGVRCFPTTSIGRLFDTVAALVGFTREATFEGQAAMWLEHLAASARVGSDEAYPFPVNAGELDYRPLLAAVVADRVAGRDVTAIARAFHVAVAEAIVAACARDIVLPIVASGGVFQNRLLVELLRERCGKRLWLNETVPCNDGGLALGQAALAALGPIAAEPLVGVHPFTRDDGRAER